MTPAEILAAREALGLDRAQFAAVLGYGADARIYELEAGRRKPGPAAERLIRAYLDGYRPEDWPIPFKPARKRAATMHKAGAG